MGTTFQRSPVEPVTLFGNCGSGQPGDPACAVQIVDLAVSPEGVVYTAGFRAGTILPAITVYANGKASRTFHAQSLHVANGIAVNSTHVFAGNGQRFLRFSLQDDRDLLDVSLPFVSELGPMVVLGDDLVVSDGPGNRLAVVSALDPTKLVASGEASNPGAVAVDASGTLWVAEADAQNEDRRRISTFDGRGKRLSTGAIVVDAGSIRDLTFDPQGRLWVVGSDDRIAYYDVAGPKPVEAGTWGTPLTAAPPRALGPGRVHDAVALGFDAKGTMYIAEEHGDQGTSVSAYAPGGQRSWVAWTVGRDWDGVALDPDDDSVAYGKAFRYRLDWSTIAGRQWWPEAYLLDRAISLPYNNYRGIVCLGVRRIGGRKVQILSNQQNLFLLLTEIDDAANTATPFFLVARGPVDNFGAGAPTGAVRWTWTDADGDRRIQETEVRTLGPAADRSAMSVDAEGGLWFVAEDARTIAHLPAIGLDDRQRPRYGDEERRLSLPGPLGAAGTQVHRVLYQATEKRLIVTGRMVGGGGEDPTAGDVMDAYAAVDDATVPLVHLWSAPLAPAALHIVSVDVNGDLLFAAEAQGGGVRVHDLRNTPSGRGALLARFEPRPGERTLDSVELSTALLASRTSEGQYVVTVSERRFAKNLVYRFDPAAPHDLRATRDGRRVTVAWQPPFFGDATRFEVFRSTQSRIGYQSIGHVRATAFVDAPPVAGIPLHYRVAALHASGASAVSYELMVPAAAP